MIRFLDIFFSFCGLLLLLPVFLILYLFIRIESKGPGFYSQIRVGKGGKDFRLYKFRSMRVAKAATEASLRPDEDRIFPFGHFIRKVKICMRAPGEDMILQIKSISC